MSDDLRQFQSDLDKLMSHTRRRLAMLDGVGRFLNWMMSHARDEERMMAHFILPEHQAPASPFMATTIPDPGFEPDTVASASLSPHQDPPPRVTAEQMQALRNEIFHPRGD